MKFLAFVMFNNGIRMLGMIFGMIFAEQASSSIIPKMLF